MCAHAQEENLIRILVLKVDKARAILFLVHICTRICKIHVIVGEKID